MSHSSLSASSRPSAVAPAYRLKTPPVRNLGVPIAVVMRGHRASVPFGYMSRYHAIGIPQSSPTLTEPCSSPLPLIPGSGSLRRTYAIREPPDEGKRLGSLPAVTEFATHTAARASPPPRKPTSPDPFYTGTPPVVLSPAPTDFPRLASSPARRTFRLSWSSCSHY